MESQELQLNPINTEIAVYSGASMLKITDEEQTKLTASFDEELIEIRPDGLIFLPQTFWRQRLNQAFGIGQWCLIIKGQHKDPDPQKDKLYVHGILMARGCYLSEAVGEAELHSDNKLQSWASVWEAAKSDCITRCCKDLSIATELWQPQFSKAWVAKYAVEVWCDVKDRSGNVKKKKMFRKKTAAPFWNESKGNSQPVQQQPQPQQATQQAPAKEIPADDFKPEAAAKYGLKPEDMDAWQDVVNQCKDLIELKQLANKERAKFEKYPPLHGLLTARRIAIESQSKAAA